MEKKEEFKQLVQKYIKRDGIDKLMEFLETTDFYTAPASTRFHNNFEGGLCAHSINVFNRLLNLIKNEYGESFEEKYSMDTIATIALFHDLCKVNTFVKETRNVKEYSEYGSKQDSKGRFEWVEKESYTTEDTLPYGHGEKSVYMMSAYIKLSRAEAMAINWHMGGFDYRVKGGSYALSDVFYSYPIAFLLHNADLQATYLDEEVQK